jgi:hypothetical protein
MLEATKESFMDSDWAMVADLPEWAQAYAEAWPVPTCQAAMYWNEAPAGRMVPKLIEVYLNGRPEAAVVIHRGEVVSGDITEFFGEHKAIAIEFDSIVRYVDIEGKNLLNTVGLLILPDCLLNAAAQAEMLVKLAA